MQDRKTKLSQLRHDAIKVLACRSLPHVQTALGWGVPFRSRNSRESDGGVENPIYVTGRLLLVHCNGDGFGKVRRRNWLVQTFVVMRSAAHLLLSPAISDQHV
jgi:hypothetical protein